MVVNRAPFGCMPVTVATSVFGLVSAALHMPIVITFYATGSGEGVRRSHAPRFRSSMVSTTQITRVPQCRV
jgi:hypothetical protein